jgi:hypothetical protein
MAIGTYRAHEDVIAPLAKAKPITFDDIDTTPYGSATIENGYAKLDWSNMYVINSETSGIDYYGNSGYITGVTSGDQAAYTGFGSPASVYIADGSFTFESVQMTSGWNKKETVEIQGFNSKGKVIFDEIVKITDKGPTLVELNWKGVSEVLFTPLTGKQDPDLNGSGLHVVFDDMVISKIKGTASVGVDAHHFGDAKGAFAAAVGTLDAPSVGGHHELLQPVHLSLA